MVNSLVANNDCIYGGVQLGKRGYPNGWFFGNGTIPMKTWMTTGVPRHDETETSIYLNDVIPS